MKKEVDFIAEFEKENSELKQEETNPSPPTEEGDTCMVNMGGATENDRKKIVITKDSKAFFYNNVDYCVGTGRMGLALTE